MHLLQRLQQQIPKLISYLAGCRNKTEIKLKLDQVLRGTAKRAPRPDARAAT